MPQRDDFLMALACLAGAMCRNTKHASGAVVVPNHHGTREYGIGWDMMPGRTDQGQIWDDSICVYGEVLAATQIIHPLHACTCYSNRIPPLRAVTELVCLGLARFVYLPFDIHGKQGLLTARGMGCQVEEYCGNLNWLRDYIRVMERAGVFATPGI